MNDSKKIAIRTEKLEKEFPVAEGFVQVLKNISLSIDEGKFTIIYGPSGCGKSTLLHTILGLEKPTKGKVYVFGKDLYVDDSEDALSEFRKNNIGMVYQQANWIKAINVIENVAFPLALLGENHSSRLEKAKAVLTSVDMLDWSSYHPSELSSGQQQRISLARALITDPAIIIADEPTGNLDFESGEKLLSLLSNFNKEQGKTVVMVTHDLEYLKVADKAIKLFDGQIQKTFSPKTDTEEMDNIYKMFKTYENA